MHILDTLKELLRCSMRFQLIKLISKTTLASLLHLVLLQKSLIRHLKPSLSPVIFTDNSMMLVHYSAHMSYSERHGSPQKLLKCYAKTFHLSVSSLKTLQLVITLKLMTSKGFKSIWITNQTEHLCNLFCIMPKRCLKTGSSFGLRTILHGLILEQISRLT